MNKTVFIISSTLISIAVFLLVIAFVISAKPTIKVEDILSGKIDKSQDTSAIFECFFVKHTSDNEFLVSAIVPCVNQEAETILVKLADNTPTPELYRGAVLFVNGTYKGAENFIYANKIEASCPSKRMEMLEEKKKAKANN